MGENLIQDTAHLQSYTRFLSIVRNDSNGLYYKVTNFLSPLNHPQNHADIVYDHLADLWRLTL
jgi:hypothetical protein